MKSFLPKAWAANLVHDYPDIPAVSRAQTKIPSDATYIIKQPNVTLTN